MSNINEYRIAAYNAMKKFHDGLYRPHPHIDDEDHVIEIATSIMMTRDNVLRGGSFVCAVVDNDLNEAVSRADLTCQKHLNFFVHCKKFVHI